MRRGSAPLSQPFRSGSGTAVKTAAGAVAAAFVLESYDRHHRFAIYSLRVSNNLKTRLVCRIWIVSQDGAASLGYPHAIEVAPFSERTTDVPLWLDDSAPFARALAEIAGDGVECIVEASAPPVERGFALPPAIAAASNARAAAFAGIGVTALAAAVYGVSLAVPHIAAFAVPPMAIAGTTVRAEYSASGAGRLAYNVLAPDGSTLAGGPLADRAGAIPIAIPASNDDGAYTLQLTLRGPLGTAKEVRVLNTEPRGRDTAAVTDISVDPVIAKPGETVQVTYAASGTDGYVRLLGTDGTIWGERPFSHSGKASFTVPPLANSREMRVLLHVTKGRSAAESSAGLVLSVPVAEPQPVAKPAAVANASADASSDADAAADNGTFAVVDSHVPSGGTIHVKILSPRNGMRISLNDSQSHEISGVDVGADAESVTLHAPNVTLATRYTVVASFTDGFGQESIVEPVTVAP
ncbi:MAG TPA: hypothetical protein VJP76_03090 [Candidatus Tumulicola sp.]|nr:hypothetical protein [Candidatus Tumulicola sp.]